MCLYRERESSSHLVSAACTNGKSVLNLNMILRKSLLCLLLAAAATTVRGNRNSPGVSLEKPFQNSFSSLQESPCVTLFTRNGRLGCGTADRDRQVGTLVHFDFDNFVSYNQEPYVALLQQGQLSKENIKTLTDSNEKGYLQGILVLNTTDSSSSSSSSSSTPTPYSPAPSAPQGKRTPSQLLNWGNSYYSWNSIGDGLMEKNLYGIPMAFAHNPEVATYLLEAVGDNQDKLIQAEFNYYMGPKEMNSFQCLAWRDVADDEWDPKCQPLGGNSVWATAGPLVDSQQRRRRLENNNNNAAKPVFVVGTAIDAGSLFYGAAYGASTGASNTLALLMAAKLVGSYVDDATLENLNKQIVFGFFQGEGYGFLGSRSFLQDVAGFSCDDDLTVNSVAKDPNSVMACLYPMRPSLEFQKLGQIAGMLAVDQVGVPTAQQNLYVHQDGSNFGQFLSAVVQASVSNGYTVAEDQPNADDDHFDDGDITLPPSPLTSLLSVTEGGTGGAVLAGYGSTFNPNSYYWSHLDTAFLQTMDLDAIATSATLLARAAVAVAYDDDSYDSDTSAAYATNLIPELSADDEVLAELADCLFVNHRCKFLQDYARVETASDEQHTGIEMGSPIVSATVPPNYRVNVFDWPYGQPIVQIGKEWFGAYNKQDYGKKNTDAFALRPNLLETAIKSLLNDFLGRGSGQSDYTSCKSTKDCSKVDYCGEGDTAVCTGGKQCVCSRSHYHQALDEAVEAAANNYTNRFVPKGDDEEISALYTEPLWSPDVGVRVFRKGAGRDGGIVLAFGIVLAVLSALSTLVVKRQMKKQKLY